MSHSTASTKSACVALALLSLASSTMASALDSHPPADVCESCSSAQALDGGAAFDASATIVKRVPIHLPLIEEKEDHHHDSTLQQNASAYYSDEDVPIEGGFELPAELAALIANARAKATSSAPGAETSSAGGTIEPTESSGVRYYATYSEGESCTSKSSEAFESWEESFASIEECCEMAFSWDYDSCIVGL